MTDATSIEQIEQAKPHQPRSAPARTRSHYNAILALLRERGPRGVLGSELYDAPHLYGRSPRNRISECRKDGHVIEGKPWGDSDWHYVLIRENDGAKSIVDSRDWFEQQTGKPRPSPGASDDLPLFAGARP